MRYETGVRRLRTIAARCHRVAVLWEEEPLLLAAYAFGAVLDAHADLDVVQVAFVLDLPPEELPWCAEPESCIGLAQLLEIDKAPGAVVLATGASAGVQPSDPPAAADLVPRRARHRRAGRPPTW